MFSGKSSRVRRYATASFGKGGAFSRTPLNKIANFELPLNQEVQVHLGSLAFEVLIDFVLLLYSGFFIYRHFNKKKAL